MMKKSMWSVIALMMTAWVSSCSGSDDDSPIVTVCPVDTTQTTVTPPENLTLTRAEQQMVGVSNEFAFRLFRAVTTPEESAAASTGYLRESKSVILSPISVTYALGMLNNGAAGETQQQINKVLGFGETGADSINNFCYKMLKGATNLDEKTKVMIANTIFMNSDLGFDLFPAFVSKAKAFYEAEPESRSFSDGKTRDVINQWASDHTEGMIKEVLSEPEFNPRAVSYLLNAIYFKGTWAKQFEKRQTESEEFIHPGYTKEQKTVPMMHRYSTFAYAEDALCQALNLSYGNGSYQMTILLPKSQSENDMKTGADIDRLLQSLTDESWQELQQQMDSSSVDVKLPRFESMTEANLKVVMSRLGMPKAFDPEKAEFPQFCPKPTYIGLMKQVAKIKLDEEGTEAAAVTVVGIETTSAGGPAPKYIVFHAYHPFVYVISEKSTGAILFIGQYTGY